MEYAFQLIKAGEEKETFHCELELIFVLQGTGYLSLEGSELTYPIKEGDIFAVNSYQFRTIDLKEGALAISLVISPLFLAEISPEIANPSVNVKSFLHDEQTQKLYDILRTDFACAFRAQYKKESKLSVHLRSKIVALIDDLFQHFLEPSQSLQVNSGREKLKSAVDYINRHFRKNITLDELSKITFLSSPYLSRSFQKYLGITFKGYLSKVRLAHAATALRTKKTITEVSYECGFSSTNAMIETFKQFYGITPGQYRKQFREIVVEGAAMSPISEEGFSTAFTSLMKYAEKPEQTEVRTADVCEITANLNTIKGQLLHPWKRMINAGYARDLLDGSVQAQVKELQKEVGYQYIRCKGLLDDDMVCYSLDKKGMAEINFVYIDEVISFIKSVGAKPMLELGHMPAALAKQKEKIYCRQVYLSGPTQLKQFGDLIKVLMEHLVYRFGIEEVKQWLFAPWISPDLGKVGFFSPKEYIDVYEISFRAIKDVCPSFCTCGPGCNIGSEETLHWFLTMCKQRSCIPDIITLRSFAAVRAEKENSGLKLIPRKDAFYLAVSRNEQYMGDSLNLIRAALELEGQGQLPVMLDEWSNNIWQRDLCNDTSYKSAYLFQSVLQCGENFYGMGYFNLSDQLDEVAPAAELYHGGFGLFTRNGLPKSAFRALQLLSKAGNKLLAKGEGYCITANDKEVQIFLYNYVHYDMLYCYRHTINRLFQLCGG